MVTVRFAIGATRGTVARGSRRPRERGQATAEFSLVAIILMVVFLGIVDFGRMVAVQAAAVTASREAARFGSAVGDNGGGPQYVDCAGIRNAARRVVSGLVTLQDSDIVITYDDGAGNAVASQCVTNGSPAEGDINRLDRVVVQVTVTYRPVAPIVNAIVAPVTVVSIDRRAIVKAP